MEAKAEGGHRPLVHAQRLGRGRGGRGGELQRAKWVAQGGGQARRRVLTPLSVCFARSKEKHSASMWGGRGVPQSLSREGQLARWWDPESWGGMAEWFGRGINRTRFRFTS